MTDNYHELGRIAKGIDNLKDEVGCVGCGVWALVAVTFIGILSR